MPLPSELPYMIRVDRGNTRVAVPILEYQMRMLTAGDLAMLVAKEMLKLQTADPGRADKPVRPNSRMPLALRVKGKDKALLPNVDIGPQLTGLWEEAQMPEDDNTLLDQLGVRSLPVVELELIDLITPL